MRKYRISVLIIFTFILLLILQSSVLSYDIDPYYKFSGVKSPDSPMKNTWGAFQTDLYSGSFSYEYKIDVPPGTNGLTPKVSIVYNSHSAKGKAGWVGAGWEIPQSYIQRNIQYTRKDTSDDTFELYLNGAKHDLVKVGTNTYKTKVETYLKIEYFPSGAPNSKGTYWLVTAKDGTQYRFGYNEDSMKKVNASDDTVPDYEWRWSLDRTTDSNGNSVYFSYLKDPNPNDEGTVYLNKIRYNNEKKRVIEFILEATDKTDMYLTIEQGSEVQEARRLSEVRVSVDGVVVRTYKFQYTLNEPGNKSLLQSITQYGADGVSSLPPVKFEYAPLDDTHRGFAASQEWNTPGEKVIRKVDNEHNDLIGDTFDVNGDGLPDIVRYDESDADHWDIWLNKGSGFSETNLKWSVPNDWAIRNSNQMYDEDGDPQRPNTKTTPMDINRDGYIDFLRADGDGNNLEIRKNDGSKFVTIPSWDGLPINAYIRDIQRPDDNNAPNVHQTFFDMNGDGLPDIVKKEQVDDLWYWHVWRNTGSGFVNFGLWQVHSNVGTIEDFTIGDDTNTEVSHYDMNGDGLVDIVIAYDVIWKIYLNTGSNFISGGLWDTHFNLDEDDEINETDDEGNVKRDLIDINSDGLPDIVYPDSGEYDWRVKFNTGKGFTTKMYWNVPTDVATNGYVMKLDSDGNCTRDVFDIDGDGAEDLIRKFEDHWKVNSNKSGQADMLSKITDTLGGTVNIVYSSSATYSNTRLPFNFWVVSSMTTNNGMTGSHAVTATTNYSYAKGLYDFPDREFRGFGEVTETRADGSKVIHFYYQDNGKKGKEYKAETKSSADAIFANIENAWSGANCGTPLNGVYTCNPSKTDEYTYDGVATNPKLKRTEYQNYDSYGNVGLLINYGDTGVSGDETYTYNEYWPGCSSVYIVDKPKHRYITPTSGGAKLRESFYWYDDSSSCVSEGNLTKEENWLNTGGNPVTLHEYDSYGNRNRTTDPEGRITEITFDNTYHTYPVQIKNAKNQITSRVYNAVNGQILQETDPNGFSASYEYDTFQRKIKEIKPGDTDAYPTTLISYSLDGIAPEKVTIQKRLTPGEASTLDIRQFVDGFGNLIQSKTEYETSTYLITSDTFYDKMGRVEKQSRPYLTDYSTGYSTPVTSTPSTSYDYDTLGRPILITNLDDTQISRVFDHWKVTETDENGHAKSYTFDASQRLKQVIETNSGSSYITKYTYSPLGELINITDHLGNTATITYNSLGRKTQMFDPDMWTWNYSYDRVGNLVSQTDARGVTTNITYDPLNRKTYIDYPNSPDIQFTYDAGTIGTLSQVDDGAGTVNYQYDQRLRKVQETRTVDGNTWTTNWGYDSMDRITGMTYPDGQNVAFVYNAQGKLNSITGIISNIDYNAAGQTTKKDYANGKSTTYNHDNRNLRLTELKTTNTQDFSYTYDNVGNIKSISDAISGKTESYTYDDLDRLKTAGDSAYSIQYQYNAIGNMQSMTKDGKSTSFTYGPTNNKPHAVIGMTVPLPVIGSFAINSGDLFTNTNVVTLNNVSIGNLTYYMASEDMTFAGTLWKTYSSSPTFLLSPGFGNKTVYFKVMNADGESNVKSDSIELRLNPEDVYRDDDGDGLSNYLEYLFGTDPTKKDTDGDGLSDYAEALGGISNPLDPDSDEDGLNDPNDPYPKTAYHKSFSENYALSHTLNEGGDFRNSSSYRIKDSLGNAFGKDIIPINSHPALSVTPSMVDFKTVKIGEPDVAIVTLSNSGMGDLVLDTITLTGTNAGEFSKQNDNCSGHTLSQSGTCTIETIFLPTLTGTKTANLSISSNAPNVPITGVPLYGVGTDTEICSYSISPESKIFGYYGGTGNVSVTAALSGCDWTALSNDNWITITSGSNGIGNGTVSYSVSSNASTDSRTGTMTIAESTFTITQSGFQTCMDNDGDGYGSPGNASCLKGPETDCNDNDNTVYPGAIEICCDNKDNNCNNQIDEGCSDYGLSIYFDNVENWLIVAYTDYNQTECDYSVYLKIMDSNGVLVPAEEILGLSANPYLLSDNATSPKVSLAFGSNTRTAIVSFTDTSGFRIIQILNIVGK